MSKLAVKYRPADFDEVVGQRMNCKILQSQLEENDLATGYLFTGGSGIGKTTVARILANKLDAEVTEIDGASNNSVDNIRELRQDTKLKSMSNEYKVYIIDEAHMLSNSAFNAFLKTLEEPPDKVIFILATTEPEKIMATIHTRLQRFDFTRVHWKEISKRLQYICEQEGIGHISDSILAYIAKLADGSVRSAISILEKVLQSKEPLSIEGVASIAGEVHYLFIYRLFKAILEEKDIQKTVELIEESYNMGKDMSNLIDQVAKFTVELTKYAMFGDFEHIKVPEMYEEEMDELVNIVIESDYRLRDLFNKFNDLSNELKYESDPKLLVEGELIQMM